MEMQQNQTENGRPLIHPVDREVFSRVWNRVMPDQRNSAVEVMADNAAEAAPISPSAALDGQQPAPPVQAAVPVVPEPLKQPDALEIHKAEQIPAQFIPNSPTEVNDTECFGESARAYIPLIAEIIDASHASIMRHQAFARRNPRYAKGFQAAADNLKQIWRSLSAAYFLITGENYQGQPVEREQFSSLAEFVRHHFIRAQRWSASIGKIAETVEDPCLAELFDEVRMLAENEVRLLRNLLELLYT